MLMRIIFRNSNGIECRDMNDLHHLFFDQSNWQDVGYYYYLLIAVRWILMILDHIKEGVAKVEHRAC